MSAGAYHDGTGGALSEGGPAFNFTKSILFTDMSSYMSGASASNVTSVSGPWRTGQKRPVTYNYTFAIQRDIGWHMVLDVAYVGSNTHHNSQDWNFNALPAGIRFRPESRDTTTASSPLPDVFLRPIPGFGDINISGPATTSRYDSLQVQANRRFIGGVELATAYTYAGGTSNGFNQNNPLPSSAARSRAAIQTHTLSISYLLDIPRGSNLVPGRVTKWVLDNWQVSGITTFASGTPQNVTLSTTDNFDFSRGGETCGPVQTGSALLYRGERTFDRFFNTSVFQRPMGRGDIGNNCYNYKFRGPGINNWDMSFFKNFPLKSDKRTLQFRWELYNTFNQPQWTTVNNTAQFNPQGQQVNAQFGRVTAARQERRMQLSLRFSF